MYNREERQRRGDPEIKNKDWITTPLSAARNDSKKNRLARKQKSSLIIE